MLTNHSLRASAHVIDASSKKSWWKRHYGSMFAGLAQLAMAGYLAAAYQLNSAPQIEELTQISITVIGTREYSPHLRIRTSDGKNLLAEFPVTISMRPHRFNGLTLAELASLRGCKGTASVVPMRLVLTQTFRIWSISCGKVDLHFGDIEAVFRSSRRVSRSVFFEYLVVIFLLTSFYYWAERRKT